MQRTSSPYRCFRHAGFSLVEIVLVVVIISVIASIALPRFAQATSRRQLDAAANRLVRDLQRACAESRATSNAVTISFDTAANRYTYAPGSGHSVQTRLDQSPYNVKIAQVQFNANAVTFNGYGLPDHAGSITLASNIDSTSIELSASGAVSR